MRFPRPVICGRAYELLADLLCAQGRCPPAPVIGRSLSALTSVPAQINQRQPVPPGDRRHWHGVPAHDPERDDETDPGHKYRRFKVVAPSRLEVTSSVPAELKLAHGEHEAIGVEAKWLQDSQECRMHWTDQYVSIDIRDRTATASTSAPEARPPKAQHSHTVASITAWIPERYCSVHASTAGGDIQLQGLTEAALQLRTGQGSVSVGKVRASTVDIQCSGGQVTGSIVADKVQLRLMDGGAKLERLMGNYVDVLHSHSDQAAPAAQSRRADGSQLGPIDAKMVHINRELTMVSEGGAINIGTLNCQEVDQAKLALIRSQGGDISVTGLDGKADLQSNGGDVKVQLHEGAAHVVVNSGCGDIECCVPPVVRADLRLTTPTLHLPDDLTFEKDAVASDEGLHVGILTGSQELTGRKARAVNTSSDAEHLRPRTRLVMRTDKDGAITLKSRSWREAIMCKMGLARE